MTGPPPKPPDYAILSAIRPIAAPPKTSVLYTVNMLIVTVAMVLLPLIYFALVGLAAYGIYYHAAHHTDWMTSYSGHGGRRGRGMVLMFLLYLIPIIVGSVVVFFMIKPIFAGRPKRAQPLALNPSDNPLLYAFIEKICETVGAPSPKRIDLDCELNASAGFRRGWLSMFGNDLVLTIGLPLVANLSAAEFAGVVAHEFGHFTQSVGMRLSYIIRSINVWFMRVVYERDAWDEALEDWVNEIEDGWVTAIVMIAQFGVWFARFILRILMYIGWLIGGFMLRQMEYDADAWEIKLAGSETFERTQRKLATLSAAMQKMYQQIHAHWEKTQQLPDNLSELLRQNHESLSPQTLQKIEDASGLERTGLFDSHPSLADRIRAARRAQEPGVFHDERPAAELFTSFDHPARFVTLLHYTDDLEIPVTPQMLLTVEAKVPAPGGKPRRAVPAIAPAANQDVLDYYFLGVAPLLLPLMIPTITPATNYEADMTELLQLTGSLQDVRAQLEPLAAQYHAATEQLLLARTAAQLLHAGVPVAAEPFGLSEASVTAARWVEADAVATRAALHHSVHEVGAALQRRLQLGLGLRMANPAPDDDLSAEGIGAAIALNESSADLFVQKRELAEALNVFERLAARRQPGSNSPELERALAAQIEAVNLLQPAPADPAPAAPALQLKINKARPVSDASIKTLQRATQQWLADYYANLGRLIDAAQSAEGIRG